MGTQQYSIKNPRRDRAVCDSVTVIDATLEPLKILKVLVEGLADNAQTGLWLTNMRTGIPMVPRLSPFDLLYLDREKRVLQSVELLPAKDFPPFRKPAASALVLPYRSVVVSRTRIGDLLSFSQLEEPILEEPVTEAESNASAAGHEPTGIVDEVPQPSAENEGASFELDACAPVKRDEVPEPEEQVVLVAPHRQEMTQVIQVRHVGRNGTSPKPVSVEVAAAPDLPAAERVEELPAPPADTAVQPVTRNVPRRKYNPTFAGAERQAKNGTASKETERDSESREKDWMVSRFLRWLYPGAYETDRRKGRRIPIPNLVAYDTTTGVAQAFEVGDISATGMFILTEERWPPGSVLSLSIQREGPQEISTERRIQLQAGAVRLAQNGVGLSFVMPDGMELRLWEEPARDERRQSEPEYVIRELRRAKALSFIKRVSAPAVEDSRYLIYEELSNVRTESAVNILLKAEQCLAQEEGGAALLAHPDLVVGIVEGGSWADSPWMQELWSGLLVASCTADGCDDSNLIFVKLLSQLATLQTRILAAVCEKAVTVSGRDWVVSSESIFSTGDDLAKMAGSHDLLKIHRSLAQLAEFGLLEKSTRASFVSETEGTTTNPTSFGLRMYSRCLGRRGNL